MRVFLVEDAKSIRARIRLSVEQIGAEVVGEARDQEAAINGIHEVTPDVVVVDLRLATGTGIGVLREVKKTMPEIVTIVLTNHRHEDYQSVCLKAGADYFLEKSRQFPEFEKLLQQMNESRFTQ